MAGMTVLLKVSSVKLYEDDGNGLWKDCSPNPCVLVVSRNPQGLSCSILDKSTRQPCFNRWLTSKVAITHDREDWIGWSEPSKEGLKAFGIKMKPAESSQFIDLITTQLIKGSPRSPQNSSRAESSNPTPSAQIASGAQTTPRPPSADGSASQADARRMSAQIEEDRASPRPEQNAMATKIMEQRKRLQTLKQTKDDELEREKLLMDLAKKGVEEVIHASTVVQSLVTVKRKSMVDAAAFAQRSASTDPAAQIGYVEDQVWVDHDHEGFAAYRVQQRGLTSISIAPVEETATLYETLNLPIKDFDALYRVSRFDPEQMTDATMLGEFVSEPLILAILRERHQRNLVFTMVSDVLISINPFADVQLYSARVLDSYKRTGSQGLPPHAFGLASNAMRQLVQQREAQNIVICGGQSSGKTETTKVLMRFFGGLDDASALVSQKLQCASFVLDSFGNAATHRNANSSRFSKYMNLQISPETNQLTGANIEALLLEVSRLYSRPVMERNFHVFYYLIAPSLSEDVAALQANTFVSDVSAGHAALLGADMGVDEAEDAKNMSTLLSALKFLEFSQSEISFVFSVVAACLHLKELKFFESERVVKVRSGLDSFEFACELLGVPVEELKQSIMSKSIRMSGNASSSQNLDVASCQSSLTSLIATLYSLLFEWLLLHINSVLGSAPSVSHLSLGIFDTAGFESEKNNGFSQLCVNYGCEKIQQLFISKSMLEEFQLYQNEGISDVKIDIDHNDAIVQFYEDKSYGLFSILDAQSRLVGGTDDGFLKILLQNLSNSSAPSHISHRTFDRSSKSDSSFIIKHHIAPVSYNVHGLLAANKETQLREDLIDVLRRSSLSHIIKMLPNSTQPAAQSISTKVTAKHLGISARYKDQLLNLIERLNHCHFIRCMTPNAEGNSGEFHGAHVLSQLRSSGIFEVVALKMRGYPFRRKHEQFVSMYRTLMSAKTSMTAKLMCRKIVTNVFGRGDDIHVGEHMIFYKHSHHKTLEASLQKAVFGQALTIQRNFRGHLARMTVKKLLQVQIACNSILERLRGLKLDELLRREVRETLMQFGSVRIPGVLALEKLVLSAEEREPLERQMLELLQQGDAIALSDVLSAQMSEVLRKCEALGIESDIIDRGKRLNALTVLKMQRRMELAQFAASTDLDELEYQVDRAKDENFQNTPEFAKLNNQLIRIRREFCTVLIIEHAMTRGAFSAQDGARNVDVKHLKNALARADVLKSLQPQYQQRIARARMMLDLRECIQIGAWTDAQAILESVMQVLSRAKSRAVKVRDSLVMLQEGLDNDETTALKLHFASNSKISDVQNQIKDAVLNPGALEQGKLEMLMAKAEHARLTGPDVSKLRDLLNRIQITKGLLEQAIVEKKETQLIQALNEGRELNLNPVLLQQGERVLQQIIERKNKRLMAKSGMSTPAMQAIAMSSASSNMLSNAPSDKQDSTIPASLAVKMSLIQEENTAALRFALSFASLSVQEKRVAQVVAQHVQARDLESAVSEQTALRSSFFQRMGSKFELANLPALRPDYSSRPVLGWSSQPRETSFLVMEQSQIAVRMFNDLQCIMGDKIALYPEMLSNELLSQVSQQPVLRDELAVQICSQLTNNPNPESSGRGWDFLEKLLLNGPVSVDLEAQLDLFIRKNSPDQAKHLFSHYIGQLGLLPEYSIRAKRKEDARSKSMFGIKASSRRSIFR